MPFGKFHIVAAFCPVVLSCLSSVLFDSSVQSVVVGLVVLLSCLLPVSSLSAFFFGQVPNCSWSGPELLVVSPLNMVSVFLTGPSHRSYVLLYL